MININRKNKNYEHEIILAILFASENDVSQCPYFMVHVGYVPTPVSNRRQTSNILSLDVIISPKDDIDMLNDRRIKLHEFKQTTSNYLLTEIDKMSLLLLQTAISQVTL